MKISAALPILLVFGLIYHNTCHGQCNYIFSGKINNAATNVPLENAVIQLNDLGKIAYCDSLGNFKFTQLCAGRYVLSISSVGFKSDSATVIISKNIHKHFLLEENIQVNEEVLITSDYIQNKKLNSLSQVELKGQELASTRGGSLGEVLQSIPGVYVLQSGPSIFKPVIHGLHSNRILIVNNGIRQEGQQWGAEHAPEIDPFISKNIAVIKGPAGIRYGSDAIGGVVLVEQPPMPKMPGINGELNLVAASNNGMGVSSLFFQGAFGRRLKGLSFRAQGTFRRSGNARTPHYYLENTGFNEFNFSDALSYRKGNVGFDIYYSQFNSKIGIFTGTHAETFQDINTAIARSRPITPSYFSYEISRPYQQVHHELFKAVSFLKFKNNSRVDIIFSRQKNIRSEYDLLPLNGKETPELNLRLVSHALDAIFQHKPMGNFSGSIGFNGQTQQNVRLYQMLIPNFRNYTAGLYILEKLSLQRLVIEGGARFDYRWLRAYMFDNTSAQMVTPTFNWKNITGSLGMQYYLRHNLSWLLNVGSAWRAPAVNELLSNGVHQSAVAYEKGNSLLQSERAVTVSSDLKYVGKKWTAEIDLYANYINNYIYLKPTLGYQRTARGAFPVFEYTQVNATFKGADVAMSYKIFDSLRLSSKTSILFAFNETTHDYLQFVPANRFENSLTYNFAFSKKVRKSYVGLTTVYTGKQYRTPANSDYAAVPAAYFLLQVEFGATLQLNKQQVTFHFSCKNLLNTAYRDYMDRFRYFSDQPGRNIQVKISVPFNLPFKP